MVQRRSGDGGGFRLFAAPRGRSSDGLRLRPILAVIKNADPIITGEEKDLTKLGVEAVDPQTLKITLNSSTPYFLGLATQRLLAGAQGRGREVRRSVDQPGNSVTNGPTSMHEWVPQSRIVLVKNPNFWDAANVKIDKVI